MNSPLRARKTGAILLVCGLLFGFACHAWSAPEAAPAKESKGRAESKPVSEPPANPPVVLLEAFGWSSDPVVADLEKAFVFAVHFRKPDHTVTILHAGSPLEVAAACDTLLDSANLHLLFLCGDEGAAVAAALVADRKQVPFIKLTSDSRSVTGQSRMIFEFLPSAETQAEVLGKFAAQLQLNAAMMLTEQDARGRANRDGFRRGILSARGTIEDSREYSSEAQSVRGPVTDLFSNSARISRGAKPLNSAITLSESAEMFGDSARGESLLASSSSDSSQINSGNESFFFALSADKAGDYTAQLPPLPKGVQLFGNSGWLDCDSLKAPTAAVNGMYVVAPLLPEGSDSCELQTVFEKETGDDAGVWELLGLDAGDYAARLLTHKTHSRADLLTALRGEARFHGCAVEVDFSSGRENRAARVIQFQNGAMRVAPNEIR